MPPEISAGRCPVNWSRPTSSSFIRATRSIAAAGSDVYSSSGSRTFSASVIEPNSAPDWYITPMPLQDVAARVAVGGREVAAVDQHAARERRIQADHVLQQRALAAARAAEDDEHLAARHAERHVLEDRAVVVAGREVVDDDDGLGGRHRFRCRARSTGTAKMPSTMTSRMMPETTARVALSPTAEAPADVCRPRRQPTAGDQEGEHERLDPAGHEVGEVDRAVELVEERDQRDRERLHRQRAAGQRRRGWRTA